MTNAMHSPTHSVRIWMAGPLTEAEQVCREFCFTEGACVTVTPTRYVYTGGEETGFVVGFINYPRFPTSLADQRAKAERLAALLMERLFQHSYTVEDSENTTFFSRRPAV